MAEPLQLDGKVYTVSPLTADVGLPAFVRISKMMGPGFVRLLGGGLAGKDVAGPEMADLVADLFTRLDDPTLMPTVATLMDSVQENGAPMALRWRTEFAGRLLTLCKILKYCIQAHFGDFLKGSAGLVSSSSAPGRKGAAASKANASG